MTICIYGGTFNPVHIGHINVINTVLRKLKPDKLIVVPDHIPPHKEPSDLADDRHRINMLKIATRGIAGVEVSSFEQQRDEKSYTVNTIEHFYKKYPGARLIFIMGADLAPGFLGWHRAQRILELSSIRVLARNQGERKRIESAAAEIRRAGGDVEIIDCRPVSVSSTDIRSRLIACGRADGLVPVAVERYILKNRLYNFDKTKYNSYVEFLRERLTAKRFAHSVNVAEASLRLAVLNGADFNKAYFAGLMHDCCKEIPREEQLELLKRSSFEVTDVELGAPKTHHGIAGAVFLSEHFGISDPEILGAVRYHTVARGGMSLLERIVYMADLISKERSYPGVERMRQEAYSNLNRSLFSALSFSIRDSISKKRTIPTLTLMAYNDSVGYFLDGENTARDS